MGQTPVADRDPEEREKRFLLRVQLSRGLVYAVGLAAAVAATLLGELQLSWLRLALFAAVVTASVIGFSLAAARGVSSLGFISVRALWMVLDMLLFVVVVMATGGSQSAWFPWALAVVGAAALVAGRTGAVLVMAGTVLGYLLAVAIAEGPTAQPMLAAAIRMLVLYGAGLVPVMAVVQLRKGHERVRKLEEHDARQVDEVYQLRRALDERAQQVERLTDELRRAAMTDQVTGLYNRRYLKARIAEDVAMLMRVRARAAESGSDADEDELGFVVIDLDRFAHVNDSFGEEAGDEVLRQVGSVLGTAVRAMDTVIRWDGDSFLIVVRYIRRGDLVEVVRRIAQKLRRARFRLGDGDEVRMTCCAGYSHFPLGDPERLGWDEVVKVATRALAIATADGADRVVGIVAAERELDRIGLGLLTREPVAAAAEGYVEVVRDRA